MAGIPSLIAKGPSVIADLAEFIVRGKAEESDLAEVLSNDSKEAAWLMNTFITEGNCRGMLMLHVAALYQVGDEETIKIIVKTTRDINQQIAADDTHLGGSALHLCASSHNSATATQILMTRTDVIVDLRDSFGLTPLHRAVLAGCGSVCRLILQRYPELIDQTVVKNAEQAGTFAGMNCLHLAIVAALNNDRKLRPQLYNLVDYLIKLGCNANAREANGGGTPIHFAAARGVNDLLYLMLNSRDVKDMIDDSAGLNALHVAAISDELLAINMLLMRGFDPNSRGARGETAMMMAAMANSTKALKHLIEKGADPTLKDETGATALHYAAATAASDAIFEILSLTELNVNVVDNNGGTALHTLALRYSQLPSEIAQKTCQILVDFAIDANISDHFGNRAFKYLPADDKEVHFIFGESHLYSYDNFHDRSLEYENQPRLPLGLPRLPVSRDWLEEMINRYGPAAQEEYRRDFAKRLYYFPGEPRRTPPLERDPEWWESEKTFPYTQANKIIADRQDLGERQPAVVIPLGPDPLADSFDKIAAKVDEQGQVLLKPWMRTDDRSHELPTRVRPDRRYFEEYDEMLLKRNQVDEVLEEAAAIEQQELDEKTRQKWWMRTEPRYGIDRLPTDYRPFYFPGQAKDEVIHQTDLELPPDVVEEDKYVADGPISNDKPPEWIRPPPEDIQTAVLRRPPTTTRGIRSPDTPDDNQGLISPSEPRARKGRGGGGNGRSSAATSSIVDSRLGSPRDLDTTIRTPEPTVISTEHQMEAHRAQRLYLRQLEESRPLRQRVLPTQSRADYYRTRELARGNYTNDDGYVFRDRNIFEGKRRLRSGQILVPRAPTAAGFHAKARTVEKYGQPTNDRGNKSPEPLTLNREADDEPPQQEQQQQQPQEYQ